MMHNDALAICVSPCLSACICYTKKCSGRFWVTFFCVGYI
uniref:Uncharacterized protein n=1 Tax=Anguilla anguilla TaxID=7936 RepID=A0A0E9TDZ5_ANGAN